MRLAKANNLLLNTTMSVREIGLACGFPNGFSSVYKSVYRHHALCFAREKRRAAQLQDVNRDNALTFLMHLLSPSHVKMRQI